MPGLMDTPMAVAGIAAASGESQEKVRAERDARVPLGGKMGTAWDTAYAALFLASDEAKFITGAILPVDGGMGVRGG
jgi:NAD(P)-dependent dehydrogenase (short-subunit alcohol dehydrogenase family)